MSIKNWTAYKTRRVECVVRRGYIVRTIIDVLDDEDGDPQSSSDSVVSSLVAELLLLAEEVCVARDRLDTALKLYAEGRDVSYNIIDNHELHEDEIELRLANHRELYEKIYQRLCDFAVTPD